MKIKKGDIVGRKSYKNDIFFIVDKIITLNNKQIFAILKGITIRIEADAPIEDLEKLDKKTTTKFDESINERINNCNRKNETFRAEILTGKILHLDGDKRYSEKSARYYSKMGLNAVIKNVPENKQSKIVRQLLDRYKPDILIITGHDSMLKNGINYANIYNYRNSKYFIETVKEARKWENSSDKLVIFAGACQSFYEAIMNAGADFASSPRKNINRFY